MPTASPSPARKLIVLHYGRWRTRFIFAAVALVVVALLWFAGEPGVGRWIGIVFLGVVGVLCLVATETRFDPANRIIERRRKFLGLLTLFHQKLPLAQFRQICWQSVGSWDESCTRNEHSWKVGLENTSGRRVFVNYFNAPAGRVCEEAKQFAIQLSRLTGLPLSPEISAS